MRPRPTPRPLRVLFVHQNFPGQYRYLAPALARRGHGVKALGLSAPSQRWQGVDIRQYALRQRPLAGQHRLLVDTESKLLRAEAVAAACQALDREGFRPDLVCVHPAWGEALFLRAIWPAARQLHFVEMYYGASGLDVGFDPEFPAEQALTQARLVMKNLPLLQSLELMDAGVCPTAFQASTIPAAYRAKLSVVHDGIDTTQAAPHPGARFRALSQAGRALDLSGNDEVLSFVSRNLEPQRGYHQFMRALPEVLQRRPRAEVVIVGGSEPGYGPPPAQGTWQQAYLDEVTPQLPPGARERVHFVGRLPHADLLALFQVTRAHVYLTYPFVLSWSMLEAMACGAVVIGSDTAPVREVLEDGVNGRVVGFFDRAALVEAACDALARAPGSLSWSAAARRTVLERYDLAGICLPAHVALAESMVAG